jgi:hypothetical protein
LQQREIHEIGSLLEAGAAKGLEALEHLKTVMDDQLLQSDYSGWSRFVANFRGELCVASTGGAAPNRDLDWQNLQMLHDPDPRKQETMLCSVVANEDSLSVVLTWPTAQRAPRLWVESALQREPRRLASLLVQFMFAYLENTYFSMAWWMSLSEANRSHVSSLATMGNAYYTEFEYSRARLVPWELIDARIHDAA